MGFFNVIKNEVKAAVGYQQNFTALLEAKDISRALNYMQDRSGFAEKALLEYKVENHEVMKRQDKAVYDKKGNFLRWQKRWKIPIPYQSFINEIALVSGAEGTSAMLFHVFRNKEGKPDVLLNVLSKQNGDDIYLIKDQYKRMTAFAWGYYLNESGNRSIYHVDIYKDDTVYYCKRVSVGWEVKAIPNVIGKIPVILFEQELEHEGTQPMIHRVESMESTDADVNDRFANSAMVATAEVLNSLPKAEEEAKLFILKEGGKVEYLTWDQASQSKANEYERLDKHILSKSFTPNIDFDNMKSLGNLSAKAIRKVMLLAVIKAEKRKETHDNYMNRTGNLLRAILGNVLDYQHKAEYEALQLGHEFQEPFGEDVSDILADISKQYNDGAISRQTYVEMSYLIKDAKTEIERLKQEDLEAIAKQQELNRIDVFGGGE